MQVIRKKYQKVTSTRKGRIIALSVLLVVFAAIAGGIWYWNANKKSIIREKLTSAIEDKSEGLYRVKYSDLQLDEIAGFLNVTNMSLRYDSATFANMLETNDAPPVLLNIEIPSITVAGVKTTRALMDDEIIGRKVEILNPVIEIIYTNAGKDSARATPTKEVYEQILGNLDLIQMDTVNIIGAEITTRGMKKGKGNTRFSNIDITLVNVQVDSLASVDSSRILFSKEVAVSCKQLDWTSPDKLYKFGLADVSLSSVSKELKVGRFAMYPSMGEDAFVKALPFQDDRFDFTVNNITLQGIDIHQLFEEEILADELTIGGATFKIYRDLSLPRDKENRVGKYPHQVLDDLPLPFNIRSLKLSNAYVEYRERSHITRKVGEVKFHKITANISNFTNMQAAIEKNNIMKVDVKSRFMDLTPLNVEWTMYLLHPKGRFDLKGSLGKVDGRKLNQITEPMGPARIKEGMINSLNFDLKGHDYGMDGTVEFRYENLKVTMLEKDDKEPGKLEKARTMTFLANIVIKNDNPKRNEEVRRIQAQFERDTNRSIFHLSWKTIFKGIKETVGINK